MTHNLVKWFEANDGGYYKAKSVDKLIEELEQPWVKIKDQMPEAVPVLIAVDGEVDNDIFLYDGEIWWCLGSNNVTAEHWSKKFEYWMPLPSPPKEQS